MAFPSNIKILKVLESIEKNKNKKDDKILRVPMRDGSIEERFKFNISQKFLEFKLAKEYTIDDMSKLLKTDRSNVSKILNGRLEKVCLEKLFQYLRIVVLASKNKELEKEFLKKTEEYIDFDEIKFA
jgi:hypothetical protein